MAKGTPDPPLRGHRATRYQQFRSAGQRRDKFRALFTCPLRF
jgi:hypothetical protein